VDVWGPRKYDERLHVIGLPGSYVHWVCPTEAQMRWQVWAGLRCGSQGFFCFLCTAPTPDPKTAQAESPKVDWTNVLVKQPTDAGPAALINCDGTATPQLVAMGEAFKQLAPHRVLIRRWVPDEKPGAEAAAPLSGASFTDPQTKRRYVVVTNDDWTKPVEGAVTLRGQVGAVRDLMTGKTLKVTKSADAASVSLSLAAGGGTILAL